MSLIDVSAFTVSAFSPDARPILPGFHPDPSICRVGEDYYIANSTFEWFPGVRFHRSRDLVHWTACGHALTRPSQLDMVGVPDSGGVWAPCLSYADGLFWLVYSNVRSWEHLYKDVTNYLVTAPSIEGPWSEPITLNGIGFDASLFHDEDGRKWLLQMEWKHRVGTFPAHFDGIVLQEYSVAEKRLIGSRKTIFTGTARGLTEGPHLYKRGKFYHLLTAEGGTVWKHAATMARSETIDGPYELDPAGHLLCAEPTPDAPLQKTGHASLVMGDDGAVWIAYLCGRALPTSRHCPLGRETALSPARWNREGWLEVVSNHEGKTVVNPAVTDHSHRDDFEAAVLGHHWQTLRVPATPDWLSLEARPGWLRLRGRESFYSRHHQSLVARRLQSLHARAETRVDFAPAHSQQMAGLVAYYDTTKHYALHITFHPDHGRVLDLVISRQAETNRPTESWPLPFAVPLPLHGAVQLAVEWQESTLQFTWSLNGRDWQAIGPSLQSCELSDESFGALRFTGTMIGLYAQDLTGAGLEADFDYLDYTETKPAAG